MKESHQPFYFYLVCALLKFNHNFFETEYRHLLLHFFSFHYFSTIDVYNLLVIVIDNILVEIDGMVYIKKISDIYKPIS